LYSHYYTHPDKKINGLLTLDENISDLLAIRTAWCAYLSRWCAIYQQNHVPKTVQQTFFRQLAFSTMYKASPNVEKLKLLEDPHSSAEARTNIPLSVSRHFHYLFDIKDGDKMFVPFKLRPRFLTAFT
jgi:putative endopeptidase